MANKEILLVVDVFSNEKAIDKEVVFQAMESALEMATIKRYANPIKVRVVIDRKTGDYKTYRLWDVVAPNSEINGDVEFPGTQILLDVARFDNPNAQVGDVVLEEIESVLGYSPKTVLSISAKTGQGVLELLEEIVHRVPPPQGETLPPEAELLYHALCSGRLLALPQLVAAATLSAG